MPKKGFVEELEIPERIKVMLENNVIKVSGEKGEIEREFRCRNIRLSLENNKVIFRVDRCTRREKKLIGTIRAHIRNMFKGVKEGFCYKLKICSGHFPMNVSVENNEIVIKNFCGEKVPRKARVLDDVSVKVEGDIIFVEGCDKEKVGQTSANIEQATKIKNIDRRIFQSGIFLIEKDGKEIK